MKIVIFSSIIFKTERKVSGAGVIDVKLTESSTALNEMVVVGYGVQKKSSVTGAISQVKASDIENRTVTSPQAALQGKTAGVQVVNTSSAPGSSPTIRVRGYSSNVSSDPVFYVNSANRTALFNCILKYNKINIPDCFRNILNLKSKECIRLIRAESVHCVGKSYSRQRYRNINIYNVLEYTLDETLNAFLNILGVNDRSVKNLA